jgi:hypothetical protein
LEFFVKGDPPFPSVCSTFVGGITLGFFEFVGKLSFRKSSRPSHPVAVVTAMSEISDKKINSPDRAFEMHGFILSSLPVTTSLAM